MKIIITMAGEGRRFKKEGIKEEKWRLQIKGRTMFEWALSSLKNFFEEEFIFICQSRHKTETFIREKCGKLGIERFEIIKLEDKTDGQATTALKAQEYLEEDESLAIYNIDTYIQPRALSKDYIEGDGHIPVFRAEGSKWSFVKTDQNSRVTDIAEKQRISDKATIGFYYFKSLSDFKKAYRSLGEQVKQKHGEKYVAPLYSWLLERGKKLTIQEIEREKVHPLGTPEDVLKFWPEFQREMEENEIE